MKCLILAGDIGITAPGIVYQTLIQEMLKLYSVSVLSPVISEEFTTSNVQVLPCIAPSYCHPRIENLQFKLFGRPLSNDIWVSRQLRKLRTCDLTDVDIIISCISNRHLTAIMLGAKIAALYNKPWIVYSVDAIPAPIGWINDEVFHRKCRKFINKYICKANAFYASNPQMLEYMTEPLNRYVQRTGVIYTPIRENIEVRQKDDTEDINFLYTGGIYGPRKLQSVLDGFRLFLKRHTSATFTFVGDYESTTFVGYEDLISQGSLKVKSFVSDLQQFYESANVLFDINAYFDNDVFLSSKIINYLPIKRPIISVTGKNSPSRNLFIEDQSIIHCYHTPSSVDEAMEKAIMLNSSDLNNREKYVELLSARSVLPDFYQFITSN